MNLNSSLFDRVRIADEADETALGAPPCQRKGCRGLGPYRAPMGRFREGQFWQFCLEHVREYNSTYNYFAGMSDDAVAAFQKDAVTGHRPTWHIGANVKAAAGEAASGIHDLHGVFNKAKRAAAEAPRQPRYGKVAIKALEALDLDESADAAAIRARYLLLVKRMHPDANGGDRSRETKLQEVINAYNTLKSTGVA